MASFTVRGTKIVSPYPIQLTPGEIRLAFSLQRHFDPQNILVDCYYPKPDHTPEKARVLNTANLIQIDCLAINANGIFVFESKDYSGWIYGHGSRQEWTQVLNYGREKHAFYNPIRQNLTHIAALQAVLHDVPAIYSVIVFSREATLKVITDVPAKCSVCTQSNLSQTLKTMCQETHYNQEQVTKLCQILQASRINPTAIIRDQHISEIPSHRS